MMSSGPNTLPPPTEKHYDAIIVGAGFSGICTAVKLQEELGKTNMVIFEKGSRIGGTWYENTYPGAECDVESHLYSFSFYTKYDWNRVFSKSNDIRNYMEDCCNHYKLMKYIQLNTFVVSADWIERLQEWKIVTKTVVTSVKEYSLPPSTEGYHSSLKTDEGNGSDKIVTSGTSGTGTPQIVTETCQEVVSYAKFFICSAAPLHVPVIPKDLKEAAVVHQKDIIHTSKWRDPKGKNIAVVGNGASGIQLIPQLAERPNIEHLYIFQRTPNWILPKFNRNYSLVEKCLLWFPFIRLCYRWFLFMSHELAFGVFRKNNWAGPWTEWFSKKYINWIVKDKEVAAKLIPTYPIGCKRILLSDDYIPVFNNPKVTLITDKISGYNKQGVVTANGTQYNIDSFVVATGFDLRGALNYLRVHGRHGQPLLESRWKENPEAFLGTFVDGFPNAFLLAGPNSGTAHISLVIYIEAQVQAIVKLIKHMDRNNYQVSEVKTSTVKNFCAWLDDNLKDFVWDQCNSWYLFYKGKNATLYPETVSDFEEKTRNLNMNDFNFS